MRSSEASVRLRAHMLCLMIVAAGVPSILSQPTMGPRAAATPPMRATPPMTMAMPPPMMAVTPPNRAPPPMAMAADTTRPAMAPSKGPAAMVASAPAPGPLSSGTVNATVSLVSGGALSSTQQQQLCSVVVSNLKGMYPGITQCNVTSQMTATQPTFATTGRRLHQSSSTLMLGLALTSASTSQLPGIQAALNKIQITIGSSAPTTLVVVTIIFVPGIITVPSVVPASGPTVPSTAMVTAAPPSSGNMSTVVTVVPPNATGNTTMNVNATAAKPPAAPTGGTSTTTVIMNSTTTTTTTTIASYSINVQVTVIVQYFYTVTIGSSTGTLTIIQFNLPGNVVTNLPTVITGGATTGSTATVTVTGATVAIVVSSTITTSTSTTTTTSTSTTTGTSTTSTTGSTTTGTTGTGATPPTTTTASGIIPGVTRQVCSVPNNPYGIIQNTANEGTLVKGAFLISSWNDVNMNFGQGRLIYQCMPNGTTTVWSNVTISGACTRDNAGVGVTMALSRCGSVIIVGSLPIVPGGNPNPGCLIALDLTGKTINEVTSPGINGPWGSVCTTNGNQITLAVSSVLGGLSSSASAPSGRRLQQAMAPGPSSSRSGGMLVRWTFTTPTSSSWTLGTPTFLLSGIMSNASMVTGGAVGPGQPTLDDKGNMYVPDNLGNRLLAISNGMTTTSVGSPTVLNLGTQVLNGPNSLFFGNGQLLGANTMDNNLFFVNLNSAGNGGSASRLLVDGQPTAGNLFYAVFSVDSSAGAPLGSIWYQHDGTNTFNTVIGSGSPLMAPSMAPMMSGGMRPSGSPASG